MPKPDRKFWEEVVVEFERLGMPTRKAYSNADIPRPHLVLYPPEGKHGRRAYEIMYAKVGCDLYESGFTMPDESQVTEPAEFAEQFLRENPCILAGGV